MARKLTLALAALLFSLAAAEVVVRTGGFYVSSYLYDNGKYSNLMVLADGGYMLSPPNATTVYHGHPVRLNSLGMRDPEPLIPKPLDKTRLLVLGDSVAFGSGVAEENAFPWLLRGSLVGVDVVTAAVPGWNTIEQDLFLSEHDAALDADVTALLYVLNDNEPINPFVRARKAPPSWRGAAYRSAILHSRLFEWVAFAYQRAVVGPNMERLADYVHWKELVAEQGEPFAKQDPGWLASLAALERIAARIADRDARFIIFMYGLGWFPEGQAAWQRLREFSEATGVQVVDARPFLHGPKADSLMVAPGIDPHPNAAGHAMLARHVRRALVSRGYFDDGILPDEPTVSP